MTKILYTSSAVRGAINDLFSSSKGRRVVITAFVGDGAEEFLPNPKGVRLVCWPKERSTNSQTLRRLMGLGVKVEFCDNVHMKVYWSEERGAVITSANLSNPALSGGPQQEIGVLFKPGRVDMDLILSSLDTRDAGEKELSFLDCSDSPYAIESRIRVKSKIETFAEWWDLPHRKKWKLGWWDSTASICAAAREKLRNEYRRNEPGAFLAARQNEYARNDWVLMFKLGKMRATQLDWMYVDFVVLGGSDRKNYPFEAVQAKPLSTYSGRPFKIDDRFASAFAKAITEFGPKEIKRLSSLRPPQGLLNSIYDNYSRKCRRI